ncbi:MAG: TauD/TfdA family dioxygenase [Pseudomonadota bacterium]
MTIAQTPQPFSCHLPTLAEALAGTESALGELKTQIDKFLARESVLLLDLSTQCESLSSFRSATHRICAQLGPLMAQNEAGDVVIEVYDRHKGSIADGARYHQTRDGGDIHTDSVNRAEAMKYIALGCACPAQIGGETILVRAKTIYDALKPYPDILETLRQPFWFEGRGMQETPGLFQLSVLQGDDDNPRFRYLRGYIESAHDRAGAPLTMEQQRAFDVLDALLDMARHQHRFVLDRFQLLLTVDTAVFHGRTRFVDGVTNGAEGHGRHMLRYWIEES